MPVVLRHNAGLEMNLAEYHGQISLSELEAVAAFLAVNPDFLKRDTLSVVHPAAAFTGILFADLDRLFGRYRTLYAPLNFEMLRRSAWLCFSPEAQTHVDYWLGGRDAREAMSTTVRQLGTYAEAGEWLVLNAQETNMLQTGEGFAVVASFDLAPTTAHVR